MKPNKYSETKHRHIYNDTRWRKLSKLRRSIDPLCVICKQNGFTTVATEVDHILPLDQGGQPFDLANTQSICGTCHNRKTNKERGEISKKEAKNELETKRTKNTGGYISL